MKDHKIINMNQPTGDDAGKVDCLKCEKQMLKHLSPTKDWTKKCTCENFQQNEGCEHTGDKVLEEVGLVDIGIKDGCGQPVLMEQVGLGVGDKDCPDCKVNVGCAKHFIQNGDRHDRLEGALTPLGEALQTPCPSCQRPWKEHGCPRRIIIEEVFKGLSGDGLEEKFFSLLDLYDDNTPMTWNGINRDILIMFLKNQIREIAYKTHDIAQENWNDVEYRANYMQELLTSLFRK